MDEKGNMPPAEGTEERRTEGESLGKRTEEEAGKKPPAEDAGPAGEARSREGDPEGTGGQTKPPEEAAGQALGGPDEPAQEGAGRESAGPQEGREEEDKGLLDKVKDRLKGAISEDPPPSDR